MGRENKPKTPKGGKTKKERKGVSLRTLLSSLASRLLTHALLGDSIWLERQLGRPRFVFVNEQN
jgi:hypothetical protein